MHTYNGLLKKINTMGNSSPSPLTAALFQSGTSTLSASETSHFIHTLKGIFSSNELFRDRTDEDYIKLIGFFKEEFAKCGCHITTPGKKGNKMFIIKEGTVDVIIDEIKVNTLERGAVIGELSLLHGAPRSALCQVSSAEGAVLYSLSRERFLEFVDKSFDARDRELSRRLANVPELGAFVERAKLVKCMTPRRYALGDKLYKQSYPANQVIVVDSGFAAVFTRDDLCDLSDSEIDATLGIYRDRAHAHDGVDESLGKAEQEYLRELKGRYIYNSDTAAPVSMYFACVVTAGCVLGMGVLRGKAYLKSGWKWEEGSHSNNYVTGAISPFTCEVISPRLKCDTLSVFVFDRLFGAELLSSKEQEDLKAMRISQLTGLRVYLQRGFVGSYKTDWELLGGGTEYSYGIVLLATEATDLSNASTPSPSSPNISPPSGNSPLRSLFKRVATIGHASSFDVQEESPTRNRLTYPGRSRSSSPLPLLPPPPGEDVRRSPINSLPLSALRRMVSFRDTSPVNLDKSRNSPLLSTLVEKTLTSVALTSSPSDDGRHSPAEKMGPPPSKSTVMERPPRLFAVKIFNKIGLASEDTILKFEELVEKMKLLASLNDCPFVVKLLGVTSTRSQLGFVMEPLLHGSLKLLLRRYSSQKESVVPLHLTQFICACIASALDFLRERLVVYRDLSPRSVLFDARGYPRLIDFTRSKKLEASEARFDALMEASGMTPRLSRVKKTHTLIGPADSQDICYRAPEFVANMGHELPVDLWSFGVILYELLVGKTPFDWLSDPEKAAMVRLCPQAKLRNTNKGCTDNPADDSDYKDCDDVGESVSDPVDLGLVNVTRSERFSLEDFSDTSIVIKPRALFQRMILKKASQGALIKVPSQEGRDLVMSLIRMRPEDRWLPKKKLLNHSFFNSIDREGVLDGSYCPPIRPERFKVKGVTVKQADGVVTSNISSWFLKYDGSQHHFFGFKE